MVDTLNLYRDDQGMTVKDMTVKDMTVKNMTVKDVVDRVEGKRRSSQLKIFRQRLFTKIDENDFKK